jgi:hypothetical protein
LNFKKRDKEAQYDAHVLLLSLVVWSRTEQE